MTVAPAKPRVPVATLVAGGGGIAAIVGGITWMFASGTGMCEFDCGSRPPVASILLVIWGVISCASFLRGRVGLAAFIAAVVLPLAVAWRYFLPVLAWLLVILAAVRVSKDRLASFYRRSEVGS